MDADAGALPIRRTRLEDLGRLQMEPASCGDESSEKEEENGWEKTTEVFEEKDKGHMAGWG